MKGFKLVILDYDGTLVGRSGIVSPKTREAIKKTVQKGVKVSISTGRSPFSLKVLIKELSLDLPHVFLAGALVLNPIKELVLQEEPIDKSSILETIDFSENNNLYLEAATQKQLYHGLLDSPYVAVRKKQMAETLFKTDLRKLAEKEKILIMRMVIDKKNDHLFHDFQDKTQEKLNFQVGYPYDYPEMEIVNITDISVSKVSALRHLCQYLKISPEETIAMGDSPIDLPLIENVGLGIAVGNATKIVKNKAKWITKNAEEDGVAVALEKFVLNS